MYAQILRPSGRALSRFVGHLFDRVVYVNEPTSIDDVARVLRKRIRLGKDCENLTKTEAWAAYDAWLAGAANALRAEITAPNLGIVETKLGTVFDPTRLPFKVGALSAIEDAVGWMKLRIDDGRRADAEYVKRDLGGRVD